MLCAVLGLFCSCIPAHQIDKPEPRSFPTDGRRGIAEWRAGLREGAWPCAVCYDERSRVLRFGRKRSVADARSRRRLPDGGVYSSRMALYVVWSIVLPVRSCAAELSGEITRPEVQSKIVVPSASATPKPLLKHQ